MVNPPRQQLHSFPRERAVHSHHSVDRVDRSPGERRLKSVPQSQEAANFGKHDESKLAHATGHPPRDDEVEQRVKPIRNFGGVEVSEEHALFETDGGTLRLPPRRGRRPRTPIAGVKRLYRREETIGELSRHEGEVVRHRPGIFHEEG